jgi:hypothetical protein
LAFADPQKFSQLLNSTAPREFKRQINDELVNNPDVPLETRRELVKLWNDWSSGNPPPPGEPIKSQKTFSQRFNECMKAASMPVPSNLGEGAGVVLGLIKLVEQAVKVGGPEATLGLLYGAALFGEKLSVLAGIGASAYLGICTGCLIGATIDEALE